MGHWRMLIKLFEKFKIVKTFLIILSDDSSTLENPLLAWRPLAAASLAYSFLLPFAQRPFYFVLLQTWRTDDRRLVWGVALRECDTRFIKPKVTSKSNSFPSVALIKTKIFVLPRDFYFHLCFYSVKWLTPDELIHLCIQYFSSPPLMLHYNIIVF